MPGRKIEQFEFRVGGKVVWKVESRISHTQATANQPTVFEERNLLVAEGVRRAVGEYGEVMRKLANE